MDIVTGNGILSFQFFDGTARRIDLHLAAAVFAAQEIIIICFQPGAADLRNNGNAVLIFQALHIFFIDLPDITEHLSGHHIVGIITNRLHIHGYTGQFVPLFFHPGNDILRQILRQHGGNIRILYFCDFFP